MKKEWIYYVFASVQRDRSLHLWNWIHDWIFVIVKQKYDIEKSIGIHSIESQSWKDMNWKLKNGELTLFWMREVYLGETATLCHMATEVGFVRLFSLA